MVIFRYLRTHTVLLDYLIAIGIVVAINILCIIIYG